MNEISELPIQNAQDTSNRIQALIAALPSNVWHTTTPPTWFKIARNTVIPVEVNYKGQDGELVFVYTNNDGYISIQQVFPAQSSQ